MDFLSQFWKQTQQRYPLTISQAPVRVFTPISLTCSLLWHPPEPTAWIPHTSFCWSDLWGRRTRSGRECSSPETGQCPSVFALKEEEERCNLEPGCLCCGGQMILWLKDIGPFSSQFLCSSPLSLRAGIHWGLTILQQALLLGMGHEHPQK